MRVIERVAELGRWAEDERAAGHEVGVVPTMGALHDGHASLVERAASECQAVVVTIFVNPLQFAPTDDLDAYPRSLADDVARSEKAGASVVFAPSIEEMYPAAVQTSVRVAGLSEVLEGASRPGHLDGVSTVVAKLFAMTGRCRAYFGEKDHQQLLVIRRMAVDLSFPVEVVGCPIVRDHDGLALSSRNAYLTPAERDAAPVLVAALRSGAASILAGERNPAAVHDLVAAIIEAEPLARLDRVDVVEADTLAPPTILAGDIRLLGAARFGRARLIDNLGLRVPA